MKLREVIRESKYDDIVPEFMEKSKRYKEIIEKIKEFANDDEKYKYISTVRDTDVKQLFFYETEDLSKRKMIVDSIEEDIPSDMLNYVHTAQKMICDYFANNSNGRFSEKERLELEFIFKRTIVKCVDEFEDFSTNGKMDQKDYTLTVREAVKKNPTQMLMSILHEYGHAISMKKFKTADYSVKSQLLIEEGMADTFADLVARSFYKRYGNITIDGQEINLEESTMLNYSAYKNHNNVVRTMLYPLEESGMDKDAVFSYYFDDKLRFFELTMGLEYAKKLPEDFNKNPNYVDFSWDEIYCNNKSGYRPINRDSVYAINNPRLDEFYNKYKKENGIYMQGTTVIEQIQENQNKTERDDEQEFKDIIDFYEKYGIAYDEDWETIKLKLSKIQRELMKKQNSAYNKEDLEEINEELSNLDEALDIFNPSNEGKREIYDERLQLQKKDKNKRNKINMNEPEIKKSKGIKLYSNFREGVIRKINLDGIAASISNSPISLQHLKEVQGEIVTQVKARQKGEYNPENDKLSKISIEK